MLHNVQFIFESIILHCWCCFGNLVLPITHFILALPICTSSFKNEIQGGIFNVSFPTENSVNVHYYYHCRLLVVYIFTLHYYQVNTEYNYTRSCIAESLLKTCAAVVLPMLSCYLIICCKLSSVIKLSLWLYISHRWDRLKKHNKFWGWDMVASLVLESYKQPQEKWLAGLTLLSYAWQTAVRLWRSYFLMLNLMSP